MTKIEKNNRILLSESLVNTLIDVAVNNKLAKVKGKGNVTSINISVNPINMAYEKSQDDSFLLHFHEEYNQKRRDHQKEQQLYQLLLLYDEVIYSYPSLLADSYDWTELKKTGCVTHLESSNYLNGADCYATLAGIDYTFSQYLKPGVLDLLKEKLTDEYNRVNRNYSLNIFTSILFELFFSKDKDATLSFVLGEYNNDDFQQLLQALDIIDEGEKENVCFEDKMTLESVGQIREFLANYRNYIDPNNTDPFYSHESMNNGFKYNDYLASEIFNPVILSVLIDLEISTKYSVDILNPQYSIEKLGSKEQNIANIDDAYGTLKIMCSRYISSFVQLSSIQDTLDFKEKNSVSIKRIQTVFNELLYVLVNDGKESMIKKATEDIRKASRDLNFGKTLTKIDTWNTFITLPMAAIENYCSMPPIVTSSLGIYAIGSFLIKKHIQNRNNWVTVIR